MREREQLLLLSYKQPEGLWYDAERDLLATAKFIVVYVTSVQHVYVLLCAYANN